MRGGRDKNWRSRCGAKEDSIGKLLEPDAANATCMDKLPSGRSLGSECNDALKLFDKRQTQTRPLSFVEGNGA